MILVRNNQHFRPVFPNCRRCLEVTVGAEWAAWANGVAVRELDFHDTFHAEDYSHPGDSIPAILAVAQQCGCNGMDLIRGLATGYEIQIDLVKGIASTNIKSIISLI